MESDENFDSSEEMEALKSVAEEITQHQTRLKALNTKGSLAGQLSSEVVSTVLPLLFDLAQASVSHAEMMEDWMAALEEHISDGAPSALSPDEVELFKFLFERLHDFVEGASKVEGPPELKAGLSEINKKIAQAMKILERFNAEAEEEASQSGEEDADDADSSD